MKSERKLIKDEILLAIRHVTFKVILYSGIRLWEYISVPSSHGAIFQLPLAVTRHVLFQQEEPTLSGTRTQLSRAICLA